MRIGDWSGVLAEFSLTGHPYRQHGQRRLARAGQPDCGLSAQGYPVELGLAGLTRSLVLLHRTYCGGMGTVWSTTRRCASAHLL